MPFLSFLSVNRAFLGAATLLSFGSCFGQSFFIAVFAAQIMEAFDLSDGEWGGIYTLATTMSAILMVFAGSLTDRFRARQIALVVMPCLALTCLAMAWSTTTVALVMTIFALRFFGQGMMSHLAIVSTARWFVATRGRALAIVSLGYAASQAVLPVIYAAAMQHIDWRTLWIVSGASVLVMIPFVLRLLKLERTPQSVVSEQAVAGMNGLHWTRGDVLRHPLFWLSVPLLLGPPAWGTALFFQQVHLAEVKGWPLVDYLALLPVYTVTSITATFAAGSLIDRFGTASLMMIYLVPFALAFWVIGQASTLTGAALGLAITGIAVGFQQTLPASYWAQFFGTRHLGAIKAMATGIMVFGSAIGPGITGWLIDYGYDFPSQMTGIALYFCGAAILISVGIWRVRPSLPAAS